ncbi:hypothetical protein ACTWP5_27375 [Streptomyces sp. 4N509B]|uniref:hypothetical protein n=1 Tax=Streptomyces sp. 4N509B TaxID=3457413 RepID=UPI003FD3C5C4
MRALVVVPAKATTPSAGGDSIDHLYCCDRGRALCGTDIADEPETDGADCVVCLDLDLLPCPVCGWHPNGGDGDA